MRTGIFPRGMSRWKSWGMRVAVEVRRRLVVAYRQEWKVSSRARDDAPSYTVCSVRLLCVYRYRFYIYIEGVQEVEHLESITDSTTIAIGIKTFFPSQSFLIQYPPLAPALYIVVSSSLEIKLINFSGDSRREVFLYIYTKLGKWVF